MKRLFKFLVAPRVTRLERLLDDMRHRELVRDSEVQRLKREVYFLRERAIFGPANGQAVSSARGPNQA